MKQFSIIMAICLLCMMVLLPQTAEGEAEMRIIVREGIHDVF